MDNLSTSMQEVQSLQKLDNSSLDKRFIKFKLEGQPHVTYAHLRGLKDKDDMFPMWASGLKRV